MMRKVWLWLPLFIWMLLKYFLFIDFTAVIILVAMKTTIALISRRREYRIYQNRII